MRRELERVNEAYKEHKAYIIRLDNGLIQVQESQVTKASSIVKIMKKTEALAKEFREAKTNIGSTTQHTIREDPIGVEYPGEAEKPVSDHDDVQLRSTGNVDISLPETQEHDSDSSIGKITPVSSNGSNVCLETYRPVDPIPLDPGRLESVRESFRQLLREGHWYLPSGNGMDSDGHSMG